MYKTVIFDLDDTLTENLENIKQAFKSVLRYKNEEYSEEKFDKFHKIDKSTWEDRAKGKLVSPFEENKIKTIEWLRKSRFNKFFDKDQISYEEAIVLNDIYMNGMKEKVVPKEGCYEIIKYLYDKKYNLVIATNGPLIPLESKISKLGIKNFINTIFSSEEVGYIKPHKKFYDALCNKINISNKREILFIGDDLEKDIKGGIDNEIDVCWCNYNGELNNKYKINYEIHKLEELKLIL